MTIGQRIKQRRKELKISVDDLASQLGKNRTTVYRYEKGDIENLPVDIVEQLAKALKTTPQYLMGWKEEQDTQDSPDKTNDDRTLGDLVREVRLQGKLSIEEFAEDLGITSSSLQKYETGKAQIPFGLLRDLALLFGVSMPEFEKLGVYAKYMNSDNHRIRHASRWLHEFNRVVFTDDEMDKLREYAKFLLYQREQ